MGSLKVILLPVRENLMDALLPLLKGTGRDYSSILVVFPGKRPAHFLRKALAEKIRASFIPPTILSMDEFVNSAYEKRASRRGKQLEPMDAVAILYDLQRKAPKALGHENFMSPDAFFPIGTKIYSDIEELHIEGVPPAKLKEVEPFTNEGIPPFSRERLKDLSFFYEEFYRSVVASGYSTRSIRYRTVADEMVESSLAEYQNIFFVGFFALTRSEKTLFKKLSSWEKVCFIFKEGPGIERRLRELGMETEKCQDGGIEPEVFFYQSPDTHGQVFALSALLEKKQKEGVPLDERTVIVLPSPDTLFPLYHQSLSLIKNENWNISMGYPLYRTPVFGFLNRLMELIASMDGDRVYTPDYLKFVLHPYTKNICLKDNAEITRILFHTLEEELNSSRGQTFLTLSEIEEDPNLFKEIARRISREGMPFSEGELREHLKEIHRHTIGQFLSFQNISDFATKSIRLLDFLFRRSTARLHPFFHPFTEAFVRSFDSLGRSLMKEASFEKTISYFTFFRRYILTCTNPFEGTPVKGVQVLGVLETRNLSFDRVFVLNVNEEVFPDTRKEDSLLPFKVRETLGLPTYRDRDQLSTYYFETLSKGAQEVHLFFVENDQMEKSRFIEKLLWEKQKKDRVLKPEGYFQKVQYQVSLRNKVPELIVKTPEMVTFLRQTSFSATALDTYLKCPQAFYFRYVLGLERKEDVSGGIERTDIGKFVHSVLSYYFGKRKGQRLRVSDVDLEEMNTLIEERFQSEYEKEPLGSAYLLRQQIKTHLADFLRNYILPLLSEKTVRILEMERSIQLDFSGFHLTGRLDHIEKRGETFYVIDYKTSSRPEGLRIRFDKLDITKKESWREAIGSLQLPFYLLLYSNAHGIAIEGLEAMFLLLGKAVVSRDIELPLFDSREGVREKFEKLKEVVLSLLLEIVDPNLPFSSTMDLKRLCPACDFSDLCGTQWLVR